MISTDVSTEEKKEYISKTISPGNRIVKINSIKFYKTKIGYNVVLNVESKPIGGDFEGFAIDKENPDKGKYLGQVGKVKLSRFPFNGDKWDGSKYVPSDNPEELMDQRIKLAIQNILMEGGHKLNEYGEGFESWEDFEKLFNEKNILKDVWFEMAIGGEEEFNEQGFKNVKLFLLPRTKEAKNIKLESNSLVSIVKFDANNTKHLVPPKNAVISDDKSDPTPPPAPEMKQQEKTDELPF